MSEFDPGGVGKKGSVFGFPYDEEEADLVIIPVPWDVTVSYGEGTANGPAAVLEASRQLDFNIHGLDRPWAHRVFMEPIEKNLQELSVNSRERARGQIALLEEGQQTSVPEMEELNQHCEFMVHWANKKAKSHLQNGKVVGFLGGDHSTPLGLIQALADRQAFGILQIDAHMDLRRSYEGFTYSHASIMHNALQLPGVESLVQVGIRDFCEEEEEFARSSEKVISVFYDSQVRRQLFEGVSWKSITDKILEDLPENVYVSFDIDGLSPDLCPNTGTPVPGGLAFSEVAYLLEELRSSGRRIVGFDLSEVAPGTDGDWDANVGARILYLLCTSVGVSRGLIKATSETP